VLGCAIAQGVREIWQRLAADHAARPILGRLVGQGPAGLLAEARELGFAPRAGYADKCQLCWDLRRWFVRHGRHGEELQPAWMYQDEARTGEP
jgi:hypothetical protein